MQLDKILFASILLMCAAVALATLLPPAEGAGSGAHPELASMRHGGSGLERHGGRLWAGWLFGTAMILMFVALIAFGARRHARDFRGWLIGGTALVLAAWTWVIAAYRGYLADPDPELYLALPAPTAIMAYVFLPLTLIFILCFVLGFKRWVLSDEDLEQYQRLIEARRREQGKGGS